MQELIIIAVLWFVFRAIMTSFKKKRREEQAETQRAMQPERAPVAPVQARPASVWDQINEMYAEGRNSYDQASYADDEGCIGGSIEHVAHEGSYAPGSLDYTPTTEHLPVDFGETAQKPRAAHTRLTGKDMRSAVIMAEVLGKPVALRGN